LKTRLLPGRRTAGGRFASGIGDVPIFRVLLVDTDASALSRLAAAIEERGFEVTVARDFEQAIVELKRGAFGAVVTAHHLGPHNGLHLVLRAQRDHPGVLTIVTTPVVDTVLESEAAVFGSLCLTAPWNDPSLLATALRGTAAHRL
jgi:ActR/RegA family two-component response regulator